MKLIESKAEYIPQEDGLEGIYKMIELAGRTAYHSLDKITSTSAKDFVDRMIKSKHGAALEHGTVYLAISITTHYSGDANIYIDSPYCKVNESEGFKFKDIYGDAVDCWCITTNLRFIQENDLWGDVKELLCSPTEFHEKRYTMRFTCSRAIAQELTRHRTFSFLMESQRYINYSKERHGGEITYIIPSWYSDKKTAVLENPKTVLEVNIFSQDSKSYQFEKQLSSAEAAYFRLLNEGCTPQQARDVLPNATKTELIMTGFSSDWARLFELRLYESTGKVAPDMKVLMQKAWKEFENYGITRDLERYIKL